MLFLRRTEKVALLPHKYQENNLLKGPCPVSRGSIGGLKLGTGIMRMFLNMYLRNRTYVQIFPIKAMAKTSKVWLVCMLSKSENLVLI